VKPVIDWHDIITTVLAVVAVVSMAIAAGQLTRGRTTDRDGDRDMLVRIDASTSSTDQRLARIEVKMDDHSTRISALEARVADVDQRVGRIESRCDDRVGGTD
jgi:hypothetical protein